MCCTIVEPPEDNREKKLLDEASSRMIIYHAEHVTPHGPSKP